MSGIANSYRGEAEITLADSRTLVPRPSFEALVAAESELGPLFDLVERAAEGRLGLGELAALFWHCRADRSTFDDRDALSEQLLGAGLVKLTPALKRVTGQILLGR